MITRTFDAQRLNVVLNHPEVFRWVSAPGVERFDFTSIAAEPRNVVLMNDHGGFVCVPQGEGVYEVHTQFLPEGRKGALRAAREATAYMFEQTDCVALSTYVPEGNKGAKRLTELMGFAHTGREGSWTYPDGTTVPIDRYLLTKEVWLCRPQQS
jgi:hypothetical protein